VNGKKGFENEDRINRIVHRPQCEPEKRSGEQVLLRGHQVPFDRFLVIISMVT